MSNFSRPEIERILAIAKIKPAVNQIETHPYLVQADLLKYAKEKGKFHCYLVLYLCCFV